MQQQHSGTLTVLINMLTHWMENTTQLEMVLESISTSWTLESDMTIQISMIEHTMLVWTPLMS